MWCFGDSFDLYAAPADAIAGYWDSGALAFSLATGRFTGIATQNIGSGTWFTKASGANDAVHHITVAFFQSLALSGTTLGAYLELFDGTTAQCSIVFRSDGAILLVSGAPNSGTTLATYTGAVTVQNQWFAFEIEVVINNTTGSFKVRTNNASSDSFSATGLNTRPVSTNNYANKLTVGVQTAVNNQLIDDLLWRSDPSSVPWVGDIRTYVRMPASDVSKQFSTSLAGAVPMTNYVGGSNSSLGISTSGRYVPFIAQCSGAVGSVALQCVTAVTANIKCSIFASAAGVPTTVLGSANLVTNPTVGVTTFTFATPVNVTQGTTYYVGLCADTLSGAFAYTTPSPVGYNPYQNTTTYTSFPVSNPPSLTGGSAAYLITINITTSNNAGYVADYQQDGVTSYIFDNVVGHNDLYTIASIPVTPATVVAVTTRGFAQKSDAGSRTGAIQLKSGVTTVQSTNGSALSTTWAGMWRTDLTDPATGAAWTPAGVNNVQIGPVVVS
jgi:hypothetical protein